MKDQTFFAITSISPFLYFGFSLLSKRTKNNKIVESISDEEKEKIKKDPEYIISKEAYVKAKLIESEKTKEDYLKSIIPTIIGIGFYKFSNSLFYYNLSSIYAVIITILLYSLTIILSILTFKHLYNGGDKELFYRKVLTISIRDDSKYYTFLGFFFSLSLAMFYFSLFLFILRNLFLS